MKIKTQIFENIAEIPNVNDEITISEKNTHHLKDVLRVKIDDCIRVIFNEKYASICKLISIKKDLICEIIEINALSENNTLNNFNVTVCFAICKSTQNELVAEKLTELGIKNLYFWKSEHTSYKFIQNENKLERIEKIIEGAARQSKQTFIPKCKIYDSLANLLKDIPQDNSTLLYCSLENERKRIKNLTDVKKNIFIFIGPEGDFSKNEYEILKNSSNSVPVTLGNSVLKSETAAIVGASLTLEFLS